MLMYQRQTLCPKQTATPVKTPKPPKPPRKKRQGREQVPKRTLKWTPPASMVALDHKNGQARSCGTRLLITENLEPR